MLWVLPLQPEEKEHQQPKEVSERQQGQEERQQREAEGQQGEEWQGPQQAQEDQPPLARHRPGQGQHHLLFFLPFSPSTPTFRLLPEPIKKIL